MASKRAIVFGVLAVLFLILAVRTTFFYVPSCVNFECFQKSMRNCDRVKFVNDGPEATWKYEIISEERSNCGIEVTFLQPKAGDLELDTLSGESMICTFPKGSTVYPEKGLDRCTGSLKEGLQKIIIKKLHTYIIENLGEIDENLNQLVDRQT